MIVLECIKSINHRTAGVCSWTSLNRNFVDDDDNNDGDEDDDDDDDDDDYDDYYEDDDDDDDDNDDDFLHGLFFQADFLPFQCLQP